MAAAATQDTDWEKGGGNREKNVGAVHGGPRYRRQGAGRLEKGDCRGCKGWYHYTFAFPSALLAEDSECIQRRPVT